MAACSVTRYILSFLLLNACHGGLPGLEDLRDETSNTDLHTPQQQLIETVNINKMIVHQPRYKCHMCEPPDCSEQWETQQQCLYCYKSSVRESDGGLRLSRGCSTHSDHYQLTCHTAPALASHITQHRKRHAAQLNITCCQGELCNDGEFPDLPPFYDTDLESLDEDEGGWRVWMTATASVVTLAVIGACAVFLMRRMHRLRVSRTALHKLGSESGYFPTSLYSNNPYYSEGSWTASAPPFNAVAAGDSTLREYLECSVTSGSGSGLPLMVQRTLAKQVTLQDCVGKGRYGEVWRGQWFADAVAVKIFFSRDEASWRRETEIYSTVMLRHENILAYIGSDMTSRNSCTQLWLITHYHPLGSLYDHLNRSALTQRQMLTVCLSTVSGLLHLHTEIHGTEGKPAIAHRDIKSKNILVKNLQGECCIADFGLAVTTASTNSAPLAPLPTNARQGTKRYMSPEMLAETVDTGCVEALRRCDVYALALVVWEVASCAGPAAREYRPPYAERAPPDPTFDDMKRIVCVERARPPLQPHTDKVMAGMNRLMSECWHDNPAVRLPVLRIKKTLLKLMAECEAALDL